MVSTFEDYLVLYKNKQKLSYVSFSKVVNNYNYKKRTGIYFLFKNENVVYVGKSAYCINSRILSHKKNKDFDRVCFINIKPYFSNIDIAEYVYINIFNPIYNKVDKNYEYKEELKKFKLYNK